MGRYTCRQWHQIVEGCAGIQSGNSLGAEYVSGHPPNCYSLWTPEAGLSPAKRAQPSELHGGVPEGQSLQ